MKLSSAILALAACAGGSSAFQSSALAAGRINKRVVGGGYGALMAATMDGTTAMSEQVANGARRKKTKQVGSMRRCQFGYVSLHVSRRRVRGGLWAERIIWGEVPPIFFIWIIMLRPCAAVSVICAVVDTPRTFSRPTVITFPPIPQQERLELATKGLQVHVIGLSIHHAQVEVREKLAIPESEWNAQSNVICSTGQVEEAAILSTCNRFEIYFAASDAHEANARVMEYLMERSGLPVSVLRRNIFMLEGEDAVWHLMRVAGGLDSLVVGEGQILSQVRQCHLHSIEDDGCGGKVLSRLLNNAVAAGKRVRSETNISKGSVSISSAAVELSETMCMKDLNLPFSEARLAVVGAGTMTRLLITHLASRGLERIAIVNRSMARPLELREQFPDVDIEIVLEDGLWDVVGRSDIVFAATSSPGYIIDKSLLKMNGQDGGRPLMLVDIAVPRNIGPDSAEVSQNKKCFSEYHPLPISDFPKKHSLS
jgi:glutamyl-tRNA reductase